MSYLFESKDFGSLVEQASEISEIGNPAIVEKDYFVTESLRIIAEEFSDFVVFKGGTSLSKGWNLIARFSEDIDLYVAPATTKSETKARFEEIADAVAAFPGFTERSGRKESGHRSWTEEFHYSTQAPSSAMIKPVVLLEAGVQSADSPTETRELRSILADALNMADAPVETDDRSPFPMKLLHFRRTFVEKLFTIHTRVVAARENNAELMRDARHYYDLAILIEQPETIAMLESEEFNQICSEYRELTQKYYSRQAAMLPTGMNLSESPALFPDEATSKPIAAAYQRDVESLCYGPYPSFEEIKSRFERIRHLLDIYV